MDVELAFNKEVIARTESNYRPGLSSSGIQLVPLIQRVDSGQQECRKDEVVVDVIAPCLYDFESLSTRLYIFVTDRQGWRKCR